MGWKVSTLCYYEQIFNLYSKLVGKEVAKQKDMSHFWSMQVKPKDEYLH